MVGDTEFSDVRFSGDAEKKEAVYQRRQLRDAGRRRRLHLVGAHAAGAHERRRDRPQAAPAGEPGLNRPGRVTAVADHDPRGLDVLRVATSSATSDGRRPASSPRTRASSPAGVLTVNGARPLLLSSEQGRLLLGRVSSCATRSAGGPRSRRALDRAAALHRRRHAGARRSSQNHSHRRVEFELALEVGERLRGHLLGQGAATSRSATPSTRGRCPSPFRLVVEPTAATAAPRRSRRRRSAVDPALLLAARRDGRRNGPLPDRARAGRALAAPESTCSPRRTALQCVPAGRSVTSATRSRASAPR